MATIKTVDQKSVFDHHALYIATEAAILDISSESLSLVDGNGDGDERTKFHINLVQRRRKRRNSLLFCLRFAGFVWNFVLPSPSLV